MPHTQQAAALATEAERASLPTSGYIAINVGGTLFHTTVETLRLIPPPPQIFTSNHTAAASESPTATLFGHSVPVATSPSPPPNVGDSGRQHRPDSAQTQINSSASTNRSPSPCPPMATPTPLGGSINQCAATSSNPTFFSLLFPGAEETQAAAASLSNKSTRTADAGGSATAIHPCASSISLTSHLSNYTMSRVHDGNGAGNFYRNAVTRDKQGHLFLDRDPIIFAHILAYLRCVHHDGLLTDQFSTGNVFLKVDNRDRAACILLLQQLHAEAEFFLLDHLIMLTSTMLETERELYEKEMFGGGVTEDWMEYRVMTVSDVANSTFLSLLNSGKGWKIERIFIETKVVFKCPTCAQQYASNSSYFVNGTVVPCNCSIKHDKSAWVTEQVQRALLVRKKGTVVGSQASVAMPVHVRKY